MVWQWNVPRRCGPLDKARDCLVLGGLDFDEILAQLGRDVLEAEGLEDFLLGCGRPMSSPSSVLGFLFLGRDEEAPLAELLALRNGALAHGDVVLLAAGEVVKRVGVLLSLTMRRSTAMPVLRMTLDFVVPWLVTVFTHGSETK